MGVSIADLKYTLIYLRIKSWPNFYAKASSRADVINTTLSLSIAMWDLSTPPYTPNIVVEILNSFDCLVLSSLFIVLIVLINLP